MTLSIRPARVYTHGQETPSSMWTIEHNLGAYPIVDVWLDAGSGQYKKVIPESVNYVNGTTCTVGFSMPQSGKATVV
jgi:hypothetical protein